MYNNMQLPFQLFTLSKEESNCPLIPQLIHFGKILNQSESMTGNIKVTMSSGFGKRVVINTTDVPINRLTRSDFIEIIDFDPIRNILLIIGSKPPHEITPLHWIIHHAKPEIISIVMLLDGTNSLRFPTTISQTIREGNTILETAKTILKTLQKKQIILVESKGVIITGNSFKQIKETIYQYLEKKK